jgi:hypothetical protein
MQNNPYIATVIGAGRYLVESGLWPFFVAFVAMIVLGCWLAPRDHNETHFVD